MGKSVKYPKGVWERSISIPHNRHLPDVINWTAEVIFRELGLDYSKSSEEEASWRKAIGRTTDRITFSLWSEERTSTALRDTFDTLSVGERIKAGQMLADVAAVRLIRMRNDLKGTTLRSVHQIGGEVGNSLVSEFKKFPASLQKALIVWWEADSPNSEALAEELFKFQGYSAEAARDLARGVSFLMEDPHEIELATRLPVRYGFLVLKNAGMIMDLIILKTKKYLQENGRKDPTLLYNISSDRVLRELVSLGLVLREGDPQDLSSLGKGLGLEYIVQLGNDMVKDDYGKHKIHNVQIGLMRAYANLVGENSIVHSRHRSQLPGEFLSMIHRLDGVLENYKPGKYK